MSTSLVTIAGITVRTDTAGRYSLNDLHQAAGADPKDQPGKFFANKTTKELVSALENSSPNLENEGPVSSTKVAGTYEIWHNRRTGLVAVSSALSAVRLWRQVDQRRNPGLR